MSDMCKTMHEEFLEEFTKERHTVKHLSHHRSHQTLSLLIPTCNAVTKRFTCPPGTPSNPDSKHSRQMLPRTRGEFKRHLKCRSLASRAAKPSKYWLMHGCQCRVQQATWENGTPSDWRLGNLTAQPASLNHAPERATRCDSIPVA